MAKNKRKNRDAAAHAAWIREHQEQTQYSRMLVDSEYRRMNRLAPGFCDRLHRYCATTRKELKSTAKRKSKLHLPKQEVQMCMGYTPKAIASYNVDLGDIERKLNGLSAMQRV